MASKVVINPVTRVSGFLDTEAVIDNNQVTQAATKGLMFRGFEKMLVGRAPLDAIYFTERICGICSTAHSVASSKALETAMAVMPSEQGVYLRDILHGCEFLQNHIRHFYQFTVPDYVKFPDTYPFLRSNNTDFRLPKDKNDRIAEDYFLSLDYSRNAHKMLAVVGGKVPHNHGVFLGGIASAVTVEMIANLVSILEGIEDFIENRMIPDTYEIADYYQEYFYNGTGYGNLLSYGCFDNYPSIGTLYVNPLTWNGSEIEPFDPNKITLSINSSFFQQKQDGTAVEDEPDINKTGAYSWIKTVSYGGQPYEVGPLARQWLSGEYRRGISTMDRTIARALEAKKITLILKTLISNLVPNTFLQQVYEIPAEATGQSYVDTTRGALSHRIKIKNGVIGAYQIITPSMWNLSPKGPDGKNGVMEQSLIGTYVENVDNPVELGRVIRSFDPCVSCATHVYHKGRLTDTIKITV